MMRKLFLIPLLLLAWSAQAAHVYWNLQDFTTNPQKVRSLAIYPLGTPYTNGGTGIITRDKITVPTGTNGTVTVSNIFAGSYRSELQGTTTTTTNYYVFPSTNGVINAADYTAVATNALGASLLDSRYVKKAGDTMTGPLTNAFGFYGDGSHLTGITGTGSAHPTADSSNWTADTE